MSTSILRRACITVAFIATTFTSASAADPPQPTKSASETRAKAANTQVRMIDWDELLPPNERNRKTLEPPPPTHDYLGEDGPPAMQSPAGGVNQELAGARVKLPGFIVPLELSKDGIVTEFFLVPYFGACIHVPPPPPNQIVYVKTAKGIALDSMYEAYWVTGTMQIQNKSTRLGAAAYALTADTIELYKY